MPNPEEQQNQQPIEWNTDPENGGLPTRVTAGEIRGRNRTIYYEPYPAFDSAVSQMYDQYKARKEWWTVERKESEKMKELGYGTLTNKQRQQLREYTENIPVEHIHAMYGLDAHTPPYQWNMGWLQGQKRRWGHYQRNLPSKAYEIWAEICKDEPLKNLRKFRHFFLTPSIICVKQGEVWSSLVRWWEQRVIPGVTMEGKDILVPRLEIVPSENWKGQIGNQEAVFEAYKQDLVLGRGFLHEAQEKFNFLSIKKPPRFVVKL